MQSAAINLFQHALDKTSPADIQAYAPMDPGYANYVNAFTNIFDSRKLPSNCDFDISETIGLTLWSDPSDHKDPTHFRRFRTFTTAIGLALAASRTERADELCPNYLAITLIDDASLLTDPQLLSLLAPAIQELIDAIPNDELGESQFLLLALIILHFLANTNADATLLAEQLIANDSIIPLRKTNEFLWGNTFFDTLHPKWKHYVQKAILPTSPTLKFLKDTLLG